MRGGEEGTGGGGGVESQNKHRIWVFGPREDAGVTKRPVCDMLCCAAYMYCSWIQDVVAANSR